MQRRERNVNSQQENMEKFSPRNIEKKEEAITVAISRKLHCAQLRFGTREG